MKVVSLPWGGGGGGYHYKGGVSVSVDVYLQVVSQKWRLSLPRVACIFYLC